MMTQEQLRQLLVEQFALDYGCAPDDFACRDTLIRERSDSPQARKREEPGILSMLSYGGKLLIAAAPELLDWSGRFWRRAAAQSGALKPVR